VCFARPWADPQRIFRARFFPDTIFTRKPTAVHTLTFGNAILGIVAEARRLFPGVALDENRAARGTGLMNLLAGGLGAPPMCFGSGGMAAQVACGARTGRAPIFLGSVLRLAGLFASGQPTALLSLLPAGRHALRSQLLTHHRHRRQRLRQGSASRPAHYGRRVGLERWLGGGRGCRVGSGTESESDADLRLRQGFFISP
jgi:hypothetical protein